MPSKKKKYNARFPAGRIKKIMQTDEEIGKVAQAVPVIISRTLELFVESLLKKAMQITSAKNARTLTPTHMKQCILSESRFDFLKDLVKGIPDISSIDDEMGNQCGSNPGAPLVAKTYPAFQFHQSFDSNSSRSSNIASQQTTLQNSQPKFYQEIPIGDENPENDASCEKAIPPALNVRTVIQRTGFHQLNHFPSPGLPSPPTTALNSSDKVPHLAWNPTGRNATNVNELGSNSVKKQNENSTLAGEREKKNLASKEGEDEDEEDEEEEEEDERHEIRENGYHKGDYAIDEDYDT